MHATPLQKSDGFKVIGVQKPLRKTTAYYLFNEDAAVMFNIDYSSFKARNKMFGAPVVTDGSYEDMQRLTHEMISTSGTVMQIIDLFADGATIGFAKPEIAADVYRRIVNHLEFHLLSMKTDIRYIPPAPEDFQNMSEFATVIRPWAKDHVKDIDALVISSTMRSLMPVRPSFSAGLQRVEEALEEMDEVEVPKSVSRMDSIQRQLELLENGR